MAANNRRIKLLLAMLAIAFVCLGGRIVYLQFFSSELARTADQKQQKLISGEDIPRGNILDRNGRSLTDSKVESGLIVFPSMLFDRKKTADQLAEVIGVSPAAISAMLENRSHAYFSCLTEEQLQEVMELEIYGIYTSNIKVRYGQDSLARHIVGHINSIDAAAWAMLTEQKENPAVDNEYNLNDAIGVKGIEAEYEDYLHPSNPEFFLSAVMDARGNVIPGLSFKQVPASANADKENNVYLTIDKELQRKVEESMNKNIDNGAVVVMEVATGDILAVASRPNYNQNLIADSLVSSASNKAFNNRALEFYNPGSVFKVLIAAAALEEGLVTPDELFFCDGKYTLNTGLVINCWKPEEHGLINFVDGFANFCNPVFIEVGLRLGREKILEYGNKFGLSKAQIIGYPTSSFQCMEIERFGDGKIANAALGQEGIRLSPLQVASMLSVIASGGYYQPPRLVSEITNQEGETLRDFERGQKTQVINSDTAEQVQQMLAEAVIRGTGGNAWIPKYGSAGKTGSAETGRTGQDGKSIKNVWFAGYAPLKDPRFAIVVLKEEGDSGGGDAAPVFREIAEYALENL